MDQYVIITAGGTGLRMGSDVPKQFLPIKNKPILMHTIERFIKYNANLKIILSLPEEYINMWNELCEKHNFNHAHDIVPGGRTRFHSVKNALKPVKSPGITAVHDGVRPLVSTETIRKTFETAKLKGSGVASQKIVFSLRKLDGSKNTAVNRTEYIEIQTPQTFNTDLLKNAYKSRYNDDFTDDATVVERNGTAIHLTEGNPENIKITTKNDILIAESLIDRIF